MTKATVTKLFIGGALSIVAGGILLIAAVWIAIVNDVFVMSGNQVVGVRGSSLAWSMLGLGIVGGLTMVGGMIVGFVSWIGALMNTSQLESKTWFLVLLLLGLFSFGFVAMIAYVVAGPDGTARPEVSPAHGTT
jgi:hypothetical protein